MSCGQNSVYLGLIQCILICVTGMSATSGRDDDRTDEWSDDRTRDLAMLDEWTSELVVRRIGANDEASNATTTISAVLDECGRVS